MKNMDISKWLLVLFQVSSFFLVLAIDKNHHHQVRHASETTDDNSLHNTHVLVTQRNLVTVKTLNRVGNDGDPTSVFPLQKCQGDCDDDDDCFGTFKCFQRKKGDDIRKIPGCTAKNVADATNDGTDYCYDPSDSIVAPTKPSSPVPAPRTAPVAAPTKVRGTILYVGEDWNPKGEFPLGLCEGECDGDFDCAGELVCHQRDKDTTGKLGTVPGCAGRDTTTNDYCINPSDELAIPPVNGAFRFKKYWENGYKWQDEFWEQEWCMECSGGNANSCEVGDSIIISHCSHDKSTWFVYQGLKDGVTQIQIATTNLCLEWVSDRDILVRTCNGTNERQKFKALNGTFGGKKFELSTVQKEWCLSQHHHPKDEELIYLMDCALTRKHTTSFWMQY
jgi:hypothetical protein